MIIRYGNLGQDGNSQGFLGTITQPGQEYSWFSGTLTRARVVILMDHIPGQGGILIVFRYRNPGQGGNSHGLQVKYLGQGGNSHGLQVK